MDEKIKFKLLISLCFAASIFFVCRLYSHAEIADTDLLSSNVLPFVSVEDIKLKAVAPGVYRTEGFVAKLYRCPPCPHGAQCKPCMRDNIVLSSKDKVLKEYVLTDNDIIVFIGKQAQFLTHTRYAMRVVIEPTQTVMGQVNDVGLVEYELLK